MRIESGAVNTASYRDAQRVPAGPGDGPGGKIGIDGGAAAPLRSADDVSKEAVQRKPRDVVDLTNPVLEELLESINRNAMLTNKRLQFVMHETSGRIQLRVLERGTDEVIREVPSEQLLDLVGRINDLIGMLLDETA